MFHFSGFRYIYVVAKDFLGDLEIEKVAAHQWRADLTFLDHPGIGWHPCQTTGIDRNDYNGSINLFYLKALQILSKLFDATGIGQSHTSEAREMTEVLRRRFSNDRTGLLADSWNPEKSEFRYSQITNALAVMTGIVDGSAAPRIVETVCNIDRHPWISKETLYTHFFIADAAIAAGIPHMALEMIRREWTPMLERGATTTWETLGGENHDSLNHAWSAPLPYLLRKGIAGITPGEPGYGEVPRWSRSSQERFRSSSRRDAYPFRLPIISPFTK